MYSVAAAPLTVRHHFAIRAVPLEAGAAVETREILPVIAEALVGVVQETVGLVFAVVIVSEDVVDSRSLLSVTLITKV